MNKSFGCLFHLKRKGNYENNEIDIYLKITVDSAYVELSTKRKCFRANWNVKAGRVEGKNDYAKSINSYLDTIQQKVFEAKRRLIELDVDITPLAIKDIMLGKNISKEKNMLIELFKHQNEQIKALVGKDYAQGTYQIFNRTLNHTIDFLNYYLKVSDIDILKLDYDFISQFEFWFKSKRSCDHNTTMKYLSTFKKIITHCVKSGKLQRDPFLGFSMARREVEKQALTESQLQAIARENFGPSRLRLVRDIFLFCCFTGLAYADVQKLKRTEIVEGTSSELWIITKRQKTNVTSRIPLLPPALEIVDRYKENIECQLKGKVLPVLSNQKMNSYLKEIADKCDIHFNLTFHIARHTFATTITLSNGVPIETVAKMLGHRNLKTTQHYAKILDKKISDDMKKLKDYKL
ncbi:MAG: site-specific integrase [Parafilimonas sp.]